MNDEPEDQRKTQHLPAYVPGEPKKEWYTKHGKIKKRDGLPMFKVTYAAMLREEAFYATEEDAKLEVNRLLSNSKLDMRFIILYENDKIIYRWQPQD